MSFIPRARSGSYRKFTLLENLQESRREYIDTVNAAWVETESYIGPCRRQTGRKKLFDRRRLDAEAQMPSLATLVRQLRVINLSFADEAVFRQFRLRATAAHALAVAQGNQGAARALAHLRAAIESGQEAASLASAAQTWLDEAASAAA